MLSYLYQRYFFASAGFCKVDQMRTAISFRVDINEMCGLSEVLTQS
jgi:hypothetical protein